MGTTHAPEPLASRPWRLWPGIVAAALLVVTRFVVPAFVPGALLFGVLGAAVFSLAIVAWWSFSSRAAWSERLIGIGAMVLAVIVARPFLHPSMTGAGMGMLIYFQTVPVLCLALVAWAVACRRLDARVRCAALFAMLLLAAGAFALVRTAGINGEGISELHWRWTETPEERLLARAAADAPPRASTRAPATDEARAAKPADWPGFRGPARDGIVRGARIRTDWSSSPPRRLWSRPVGPGWSSFAVDGDLLYTQEQRGDEELVACYAVQTGEPVWRHGDPVRFFESNGGAGPRGTPALFAHRAYTLGATGILNALDADDGALLWSRNAAADAHEDVPMWGFASSPLVVGDAVVVALAGKLAAYDLATGEPRWFGPDRGGGYSSPHLVTLDGIEQVVLLSGSGATSVAPATGVVLWDHAWAGQAIVQPAVTAEGDLLIHTVAATGGLGLRRLAVARGPGGWTASERWTSSGLKPYYNDFVVHAGHAYGFDGTMLACIALADGARAWKDGRYGAGQLLLLSDQDVLLVLSEEGELALVSAAPAGFTELARCPAIEGKTWNHPAFVRGIVLVRNGEEMAAFQLSGS